MLWNQYCLIRLSVVYRGRAVPVVWDVIEHGSSSVTHAAYAGLLDAVPALLPAGIKVVFLADRSFADTELLAHLRRLGWHFRIRIRRFLEKSIPSSKNPNPQYRSNLGGLGVLRAHSM